LLLSHGEFRELAKLPAILKKMIRRAIAILVGVHMHAARSRKLFRSWDLLLPLRSRLPWSPLTPLVVVGAMLVTNKSSRNYACWFIVLGSAKLAFAPSVAIASSVVLAVGCALSLVM